MMRAAAKLPLRACLINADWREKVSATIIVARQAGSHIAASAFMADLGCLGVKWAVAQPSLTESEFAALLERFSGMEELIDCTPAFAARLLTGACNYAASLGFKPDRDYSAAKQIFGNVGSDDSEPGEPIEYGRDGKPFYVSGPYDDAEAIINRLRRKLGPDGFHFITPFPPGEWEWDDEEGSEDDEDLD
jgi:hypothetical protein